MIIASLAMLLVAQGDDKVSIATFDTKTFEVKRHGAAKVEWDDHWFEAQRNSDGTTSAWLLQRFSFDGEMRAYNRADIPGIMTQRPAEPGERLVDDCRKIGPFKRCRRSEIVRLPVSEAELAILAGSSAPVVASFYGMTREPYKVSIDPAEAAAILQMVRG